MKFSITIVGILGVLLLIVYFYFTQFSGLTPITTSMKALSALSVYGKLIDYSQIDSFTIFRIQSEIVNGELNNTYLEVEANLTDVDITKGNNYVFYFMKLSEKEGPWDGVTISENLAEYKQNWAWRHENDLVRDQLTIAESDGGELQPGQERAVRIFSTSIIPNEDTELRIKLTNMQDVDIPYKISDVKIVDEIILEPNLRQCDEGEQEYREITKPLPVSPSGEPIGQPEKTLTKVCSNSSFEQRIQDSTLSNCQIIYGSSENTISPGSSKIITFKALCEEPVSCRTWQISEIYGNVSGECSLILLGNLEFSDELGNNHKKDNFYLKQMLTLSQKASANVDYSKEISSKDEFYIYVDYKDSQGNQIKDAQIELQFKNLGVSGIFTLRYDEALGKYKFGWSNFVEWDPGYKKGNYQFTITSIKMRYQTVQLGHYDFTLK